MEKELARLNALTNAQLRKALTLVPSDPAPEWAKKLITDRINQIINKRLKETM
jgi:hypothetical protein